jgi:hypothetical protein
LGIFIGWGNLNGVISSNIFLAWDAPGYHIGYGIILGYLILFFFGGSILQIYLLDRENKKRLAGKRDYWIEGKTAKEIEMLGDKR